MKNVFSSLFTAFFEKSMVRIMCPVKRTLAFLIVVTMLVGLIPTIVYADDNEVMRYTFGGAEYVVKKGQTGGYGTGATWQCDASGWFKITFTQSGTFRLTQGTVDNATVTVIGGGGGGDSGYSGGGGNGGAGGEKVVRNVSVSKDTDVAITIGAGGAGGWTSSALAQQRAQTSGGDGGYSAFGSVVAYGGSGGGGGTGAYGTGAGGNGNNRSGGGGGSVDTFYETDVGNFGHGGYSCFICGYNYMDPSIGDIYTYPGWTPLYQEAEYPGNVSGGNGNEGGGKGGSPANEHNCSGPNTGSNGTANTGGGGGGGAWGTWCYTLGGAYTSGGGSREYAGYAGSGGFGGSGVVILEGHSEAEPSVEYSYLSIKKASRNTIISNQNSCYSLSGCRVNLYASEANALNKTNPIATFISNENGDFICNETGNTAPLTLEVGEYWIREIEAPPGYALKESPEKVTLTKGVTHTVTLTDTPTSDPVSVILKKVDADIREAGMTSGKMSLANAEYTLKFYGGQYSTAAEAETSGTLLKTWVIKTDSDGYTSLTDSRLFVSGDSLYYAENGDITLPLGTLVIQETRAPEGFLINSDKYVVRITEDGADQDIVRTYNEPIILETAIKGGVSVTKTDADLQSSTAQGDASIAGAKFTIYNASDKAVRVDGTDYAPGAAVKTITANAQGIASTGAQDLPYGDYEIAETSAPNGYSINDTRYSFTINNNESVINIGDISDHVIRGGISIQKLSAETGDAQPQDGTSLEGAIFQIINRSGASIVVAGETYQPDSVVMTIRTDSNGVATTGNSVLPYGTYELKEVEAPENYMVNEDWSQTVQIRSNSIYITDELGDALQVADHLLQKRGDILFKKVNGITSESLSGVVFRITNTTTGETHIVVTDEDGQFGSAANAHTNQTNKNDDAVDDAGIVDESKLFPSAGIWFFGGASADSIDDNKGAFPCGTYLFEELSSSANVNMGLVAFEVDVDEDGTVVDAGIIKDQPFPQLNTLLLDRDTQLHLSLADEDVTMIDEVTYSNLVVGEHYEIVGRLVNQATGNPIQVNGEDLKASTGVFRAQTSNSVTHLTYNLNASLLAGITVFSEVTLFHNGEPVFVENDLENKDQTIQIPKVSTTARNEKGGKEIRPSKDVTIVDEVHYSNLIPNTTYKLMGTLVDKATGRVVRDANGDEIKASIEFTPETESGSVELCFTEFDFSSLGKKTLVVYEKLYKRTNLIAKHEDINDDAQTVYLPEIRTTLKTESGNKIIPNGESVTIVDTVTFTNLIVDNDYAVDGVLYDKKTGAKILDKTGNPVTAHTDFKAETSDGSVELVFSFDSNYLSGTTIVAFEELSNEHGIIAVHQELTDEDQTGYIPGIRTSLADKDDNKEILADGVVTIIDTVTYTNLKVDETYKLTGILMDKDTGEPLKDANGATVTVSKTFTVKNEPNGTVKVEFRIPNAETLEGKTLVAFEKLFYKDELITTHEDINDEEQTVVFPKICTTATDKAGAHVTCIGNNTVITDRVEYKNLIVDETYTLTGTLMNKNTGKVLKDSDGDKLEVSKDFVPENPDGYVEIEFSLDSTQLGNNTIVVYEQLTHNDRLVAKHEDIKDEAQSIHFPSIDTTAKFEKQTILEAIGVGVKNVSIVDTVTYENLIPGVTYKVSGTLMNKKDGSPLRNKSGEAYVSEYEFTPETSNGTVDVKFEIPTEEICGKTVVVFESLMLGANTVATHRDISDQEQTLIVPYLRRGFKYDATTAKGLSGAVFKITDKGLTGKSDKVDLLDPQTVVSDEEGYFYFAVLPGHQYSITELEAPDGYIRDQSEFIVDVSDSGVLSGNTEISNVHGGTIVITKTDVVTGTPLAGCEITVWQVVVDEEATAAKAARENKPIDKVTPVTKRVEVFRQTTDEKGRIYFYTDEFGSFVFRETKARDGYYLNEEEYSFVINEDLTVTGETHISNVPFGTVVVKKVDTEGRPLAGAQIAFYDEYNRYLGQGTSDAKGRVYFVSPGPGKYYFTELKAPNGYDRITDHYHFQIANDYTITGTLTLVNGRNSGGGGTNTGDSQFIALWIGVAGLSSILAATVIFIALKNKNSSKKKRKQP